MAKRSYRGFFENLQGGGALGLQFRRIGGAKVLNLMARG
jgi:hypothetical protein